MYGNRLVEYWKAKIFNQNGESVDKIGLVDSATNANDLLVTSAREQLRPDPSTTRPIKMPVDNGIATPANLAAAEEANFDTDFSTLFQSVGEK
jgi:hypothetical protein